MLAVRESRGLACICRGHMVHSPALQVESVSCPQVFALTDWKAGFHLFGYSDKQQWSADGSMLLGMRTMLSPRDLAIDSRAEIGMIPFSTGIRTQLQVIPCSLKSRVNAS